MISKTTQGAVDLIAVDGPLNAESAEAVTGAFTPERGLGRPQLVLDLSDVPLIDSAGCEALLDLRDSVVGAGGAVHLAAVSPLCVDVLKATGLDRWFRVFDNDKQAISQFAK